MSGFSVLMRSTRHQLMMALSHPTGLGIAIVIALGFVPLYGYAFGDIETGLEGLYSRHVAVWEILLIILSVVAYLGIPLVFASQRSHGLLKLFRTYPLTRRQILGSLVLAQLIIFLLLGVVAIILNVALFGLFFPLTAGSFLLLFIALILGGMSMIPLGLALTMLFRSPALVGPLGGLLFLLHLFLSGVFNRLEDLPAEIRPVAEVFPLTHVGRIMRAGLEDMPLSEVSVISYLVPLAFFAMFTAIAVRFMKWD